MLRRQNHIAQQQALLAADDQHQVEPWTNDMEQAIYNEAMRLHRQQHLDLFCWSITRSKTKSGQNNGKIERMNWETYSSSCFAQWKQRLTIPWWIHQDQRGEKNFSCFMKESWKETSAIGLTMENKSRGTILEAWQWPLMVSEKISRKKNQERKRKWKKRKGKGQQGWRFLRSRNKGKGKTKRKSNVAGDESYWARDDWQGKKTESWNDGYRANEDETAWQFQVRGMDIIKKRVRQEREETEKERKVMDLNKIKEKDKWRRSKLCEPITFFFTTLYAAGSSTFVIECLRFLCDIFFYGFSNS